MAEPRVLPVNSVNIDKNKKEQYKASRFNIRTDDKNGNLLIINSYNGKFTRFGSDIKLSVINCLNKPNNLDNDKALIKELIKRGYLINEKINEYNRAELLHTNTIASADTLMLILLPNENCNFRCTYCYESFKKNFMKESVQNGIINYLERNLSKFKNLHIEWFGGEPLTAPKIIESLSKKMIELCKKYKVHYTAGMTTNGYNLDLEMFERMSTCRVRRYQITLDGIEETHDEQRVKANGKGTFRKIFNNLTNIRDNIKTSSFHIMLRCNISNSVLERINEYTALIKREFSNDPRFPLFWNTVGDWGGDSVKNVSLCHDLNLHSLMEKEAEGGLNFSYYYNFMKPGGSVCYASKMNNFVIGSDGVLYKCTIAFENELNQVGFLDEKGKMIIDQDKLALWVTGHENQDQGCQSCYFRPSCQGAVCPLNKILNGENRDKCPDIKKHSKDYMRIIALNDRHIEDYQEVGL